MPSRLVTLSPSSPRPSSRLTPVSPRWSATVVAAVAVAAGVAVAVAVVVGVVVVVVAAVATLAPTPVASAAAVAGKHALQTLFCVPGRLSSVLLHFGSLRNSVRTAFSMS